MFEIRFPIRREVVLALDDAAILYFVSSGEIEAPFPDTEALVSLYDPLTDHNQLDEEPVCSSDYCIER
jgi:hypothetical protein